MVQRWVVAVVLFPLVADAGAQHLEPRPRLSIASPVEQPVALRTVRLEAEIGGSLARTSVDLTFFNPNARVLEGELAFPLGDGQTVTGLAMDLDGRMREAVPVEKARGRMIFEDVTRREIDPALLERTVGNNYRLRVYPILAKRDKRVVVRYTETLEARRGARIYRVPVDYGGNVAVESLRVVVQSSAMPRMLGAATKRPFTRSDEAWELVLDHAELRGRRLVEIAIPASQRPAMITGIHEGRTYFHVELPAAATGVPRALPSRVGLVWDSSGSGTERDHAREIALLDRYFGTLRNGEVTLVRLRERAEVAGVFEVRGGDWGALRRALEATIYDGATDLASFAPLPGIDEYLLVSDGVSTFGDSRLVAGTSRIHAIASSMRADFQRLRHIAHSTGGRFVDLSRVRPIEAANALLHDEVRILDVSGSGVSDVVAASPFVEGGRLSIAGTLTARNGILRVRIGRDAASSRKVEIPVSVRATQGVLAPAAWARLRIDALEGEPAVNRRQILDLGKRFSIVTRETSLIVLDRVEDYVRHDIVPPQELVAEYRRLQALAVQRKERDAAAQIERVAAMLRQKEAWWQRDFPKGDRPQPIAGAERQQPAVAQEGRARSDVAALSSAPASPPSAARVASLRPGAAAKSEAREVEQADAIVVQLKRWTPDAPYIAKLRTASSEALYEAYLSEKPRYATSTAFYLDAADELFERGQRDLAVRVLGNLAEFDLGNRQVLRILAYRLMQAGEPKLALPVLRRVLELAPDEPQSHRDLGLAYAADEQCQRAVDSLYDVVRTPWHGRFPEVELIALAELNATIAACGTPVDTSAIDARLLKNLPVDLRVVLSWDADNTDIDLWVTDPNSERAYYGRPLTWQGGRMSRDFTGGYGPEEFSLKLAKPGRYRVEAHFYGHRQQIVAGATTLEVRFQTRFGTRAMTERAVTLRLQGQGRQVAVGEFDVGAP